MIQTIRLRAEALTRDTAARFEEVARNVGGVRRVDTWVGRAEVDLSDPGVRPGLYAALRSAGFEVTEEEAETPTASRQMEVHIDGMTCRSCEILIERKFRGVDGVKGADVNAATGVARIQCADGCRVDVARLREALKGEKYSVREPGSAPPAACADRPSLLRIAGLFAIVLLVGSLFSAFDVFGSSVGVGTTMTVAAALVLGLVAGSSSCLAVSGGLLLSSAARFNERYGSASTARRMRPVYLFVAGRVLSYALLGGLIGLVGQTLTPSPLVTGLITIVAAAYMLAMGLDMLRISPRWLKACLPRMPKALSRRIVDAEGREHWAAPFMLGAATFLLPCGFTQSLQVYALTTGSFLASASLLGAFALGTAPALLALGWASGSLKGKAGAFFFQLSGALVVVLGLWNVQNGLTLAGYPITLGGSSSEPVAAVAVAGESTDPNVAVVDGVQVIRMKLNNAGSPAYLPSSTYTIRAGIPTRMEVEGPGRGCRSALLIPKLGVNTYLDQTLTTIEFTAEDPGSYAFSCGMGMYRGTLNVI